MMANSPARLRDVGMSLYHWCCRERGREMTITSTATEPGGVGMLAGDIADRPAVTLSRRPQPTTGRPCRCSSSSSPPPGGNDLTMPPGDPAPAGGGDPGLVSRRRSPSDRDDGRRRRVSVGLEWLPHPRLSPGPCSSAASRSRDRPREVDRYVASLERATPRRSDRESRQP